MHEGGTGSSQGPIPLKNVPTNADPARIVGLDVLRFIAVTLVFFRHHQVLDPEYGWWSNTLRVLRCGGWVGVDIFFVLSGFLVSGLFFREWQKEGQVSVGRFLIRRGLKIYPAFVVLLIYTSIRLYFTGLPPDFLPRHVLGEVLFLQNYLGSICGGHTWSLAVEEHFYLLLAFCVWLACRLKRGGANPFEFVVPLFGWMAAGCLFLRLATAIFFPNYNGRVIVLGTHLRMDSLMFGVFLSYLWHFHASAIAHAMLRKTRWLLIFGGVLLLTPAFLYDYLQPQNRWVLIFGFTLFYAGAGCLMIGSLKVFENRSSWLTRGFAYLGSYSYSAYLWHLVAMNGIKDLLPRWTSPAHFGWYYTPLAFGAIWVLGIVAGKLVEFPILRLRNRLFPARSGAI